MRRLPVKSRSEHHQDGYYQNPERRVGAQCRLRERGAKRAVHEYQSHIRYDEHCEDECAQIKHDWDQWKCGVPLEVLLDPRRSLIRTVLRYIESIPAENTTITVLIPEIIPTKRRHEILHNQRGRLLETTLKSRTNVVVATFPFHIHD